MLNGDLEQQPKQLDTEVTTVSESLNTARAAAAELATSKQFLAESTEPELSNAEQPSCAVAGTKASSAVSEVRANLADDSVQLAAKVSLWQKLRSQPRETAAIVVLVVTAILWLDSGNTSQSTVSKPLDSMDGFESYLSDFDTPESNAPTRGSADPVDTNSATSFGGDLMIPQTTQSEFPSTVTANYGDSAFAPGNSSFNSPEIATPNAEYPADADAYGSPGYRPNTGAGFNGSNSGAQQNRRVRFAGRIKPAN